MFTACAKSLLYRNLLASDCTASKLRAKQSNSTVELHYCPFLLLSIKNTSWHCLVLLLQLTDSCPTPFSFFFLLLCYTYLYIKCFWTCNKICARLCFLALMVSFLSRIYRLLYTYFYYWHHENTSLLCLNLGANLILLLPHAGDVRLRKQIKKLLPAWTISPCPLLSQGKW